MHTIELGSFKDLVSLNNLGLWDNDLTEIQFNIFDPDNLPNNMGGLYLPTNPWDCTCLMCWVKLGQGSWITFKDTANPPGSTTRCSTPATLANQLFTTMSAGKVDHVCHNIEAHINRGLYIHAK